MAVDKGLTLAELIDVEVRLHRDRELSEDELMTRDEPIGRAIASRADPAALSRADLIGQWLAALPRAVRGDAGASFARALAIASWVFTLAGLLLGVSTARVTLYYDGHTPVNVVHFLGVFVVLQIVLLALLLVEVFIGFRLGQGRSFSDFGLVQKALRLWLYHRAKLSQAYGFSTIDEARLGPALDAVAYYRKLYRPVERWLLVETTQKFGLAFNVASFLTLLYLVTFTDLAFSWSTTLKVAPEDFHTVVKWLGWPFSWLGPVFEPSLELVERTQYYRLESRYAVAGTGARSFDPAMVGGWWPFLAMALVTYGLLPRAIVLTVAKVAGRRALRAVDLKSIDAERLYRRLVKAAGHWRTPAMAPVDGARASRSEGDVAALTSETPSRDSALAIVWRDVPIERETLQAHFRDELGLQLTGFVRAGGKGGSLEASDALRELDRSVAGPIVVVAEAWERPGKAIKRYLETLRQGLARDRLVYVLLVEVTSERRLAGARREDRGVWQRHLTELRDPYTGLWPQGDEGDMP